MSLAKAVFRTAVLFSCLCAAAALADTARSLTLYRTGTIGGSYGGPFSGDIELVAANVLGDGAAEALNCADGAAYALARKGNTYAAVWHSPPVRCSAVTAGDRNGDGHAEVFVGTLTDTANPAGQILVFDPRTYGPPIGKISVANAAIWKIAAGDVDGDGQLEVVALTATDTYVYDARTLALEWKAAGKGGSELRVGNIDADPRPEIVIAAQNGLVLDAQTKREKWGYLGGFGQQMDLGNVDADPQLEIVYLSGTTITTLQGDTFAASSFTHPSPAYLAVGDANNDGAGEIVVGDSQWGSLRGYRATDGVQLWAFENPEWDMTAMDLADFDGDGLQEICWQSSKIVFFGDAVAKKVDWESPDHDGPLAGAVADLDGNGTFERIHAARWESNSGVVHVYDLATGALKGDLKPAGISIVVDVIRVGQLDGDAALEIVTSNGGMIVVYDGVTFQPQWQTPYSPSYNTYRPLIVANIDGDAVEEIIVGSGNKVAIHDGASSTIQWTSPTLDGAPRDLAVADIDGDGGQDLVVGTYQGFYIYDFPAGTERTHVILDRSVHSVAATPEGGGQFAIVYASDYWGDVMAVRTYSGTTLSQLWNCTLPARPGNAGALYGRVGTVMRLLVSQVGRGVYMYPLGGTVCPTPDTLEYQAYDMRLMQLIDTTADGRPELALTSHGLFELSAIGPASEARGDVNLDGFVTDADIDALARYLFFGGPSPTPGADVNSDGAINTADLFALIQERHGVPPSQQ